MAALQVFKVGSDFLRFGTSGSLRFTKTRNESFLINICFYAQDEPTFNKKKRKRNSGPALPSSL